MADMDSLDRRLLNRLQQGFPLEERPFAVIGADLGLAEEMALERTRRLKQERVIREISAIFEAQALGYQSTLVAMSFPSEELDQAATRLSRHPGVSHNYARTHRYNLWFTLALPQEKNLAAEVARLAQGLGARNHLFLPMMRRFKIGVFFDMMEGAVASTNGHGSEAVAAATLSSSEKALVQQLQEDLPLELEPFGPLAERAGLSPTELLARAKDLESRGIMRRYAAVLRHRRLGFSANAMACWAVPEERLEEVGSQIASYSEVTHCYHRPTYPDWPYSLFAMIHAKAPEECHAIARDMAEATGMEDGVLLFSTREYKKERPKYFVDGWGD